MPTVPSSEEAYWAAFFQVFGRNTGEILRTLLLSLHPKSDTAPLEVDRVRLGLQQLLGDQAKSVDRVAKGLITVQR